MRMKIQNQNLFLTPTKAGFACFISILKERVKCYLKKTAGIHHITAIVGHPQENIDFYKGVLGLRMVKQTVNFDDPGTYHLYFGNDQGTPGTIITFFPWI